MYHIFRPFWVGYIESQWGIEAVHIGHNDFNI